MAAQLMTQAEFARHRGVVKGAVSNWKKNGLLVMAEGPDGKPMVDVQRTELKLNAKIDPMRGRPTTGGQPSTAVAPGMGDAPALPLEAGAPAAADQTISGERSQLLREQRIGAAMKNAREAGDLVPLIEAERRVSEAGRAARERVQAWFRGLAEQLAATTDVRSIMVIGEEGIDQVFTDLANAAQRGELAGDEDGDLTPEEDAEMEAVAAASDE